DTEGQVLLFDGQPADTVYYSTSNGHTYGNDQVFGSAPLPYLRPVVERDDGASPTSRWRAPLPVGALATLLRAGGLLARPCASLATFLRAGGLWPDGARITSVAESGSTVHVAGGGETRSIDAG